MPRLRGAADGHARFSQPGDVARRASGGGPNALLLRAPFERIGGRPRDDGQQQGVQLADVAAQIVDAPALLVDALADERVGFPVRRRQIVDALGVLPIDPICERREQSGDRRKAEQRVHAGIVARRRQRDQ